ncbi:putative rRNA-processing protein [Clavispora lusitaniae]|uniref:rRNA-processing protein n=1 Tax=Clavispora lusitaniae TaxID=36911 RepID=A0ACD0WHQ5_CLALS|nr:putative rRNA-processing protein [Clavispora lusitaniae]QFZ32361.1 putative rRNA-processing protein [Clavispora lusitaniae]QFZ38030.1 putative rRNA-processing protein [Clavispora lusitaniae]QFZ43713.1 putative rRNA-processing protein [Clavispora lusitaniae]QFZ49390.1 putative rRNA-processing protein [Clavispora lusitaniae]
MPKGQYDRYNTDLSNVFGSTVKVKKKIKSIRNYLRKDTLPADVRIEKERALKALLVDLKNSQFNLKTKERAKKYHMVRFFERKKAVRKLKQATKALDEATKEGVKKDIKKARKVLKHAQIDVAYVYLFPKSEKYISLYPIPPSEEDLADENIRKGLHKTDEKRQSFKKKVEEIIDNDKLPFTFDDILGGKTIQVDNTRLPGQEEEIDAPQQQEQEEEEDDFFE